MYSQSGLLWRLVRFHFRSRESYKTSAEASSLSNHLGIHASGGVLFGRCALPGTFRSCPRDTTLINRPVISGENMSAKCPPNFQLELRNKRRSWKCFDLFSAHHAKRYCNEERSDQSFSFSRTCVALGEPGRFDASEFLRERRFIHNRSTSRCLIAAILVVLVMEILDTYICCLEDS